MKIIDQQLKWDDKTNDCTLLTKYEDGTILSEPLTPEEAALWKAQHEY